MPDFYGDSFAGVLPSLFDRLTDLDPETTTELRPLRVYSKSELRESVRVEVARLFNTRNLLNVRGIQPGGLTVINYGVPDYAAYFPLSPTNQQGLAQMLARSLQAFEPRLKKVKVKVELIDTKQNALLVRIDAMLVVEAVSEPVSFPVVIRHKDGVVEVNDSQ